ncbi:hypothetical protein [Ornithobacterium rhinotracheale]
MKHTKVDLLVMDLKRNRSSSHYRIIKKNQHHLAREQSVGRL